jgi:hypothetical protein
VNLADDGTHAGQCAAKADLPSPDVREAWLGFEERFRFLARMEQMGTRKRERLNSAGPANLRDWGT